MKTMLKRFSAVLMLVLMLTALMIPVCAAETADTHEWGVSAETAAEAKSTGDKAWAAALTIGLAAAAGAISMGLAISKSAESISRQPEAADKIRTGLMLGLVFVETTVIYALIVAILIVFVL